MPHLSLDSLASSQMGKHTVTAVVFFVGLGALFSACTGSNSNNSTPTSPSSSTRVIGLSGNLAFGNVQVGNTATSTLTITNTGNSALTVSGTSVTDGLETVLTASWTHGTIAAGGSQQVTFRFTPTAAQSYSGVLAVNGDHTSGTNTISISGSGTGTTPQPSPSPSCSYSVSVGATVDGYPNGGSFPVTVTTGIGCVWAAVSNVSWIHLVGSGPGTGTVTLNEDANSSGSMRTGIVTIAGKTVTFNQTASSPSPSPSPTPTPTPTPTPSPSPTPTPSPSPSTINVTPSLYNGPFMQACDGGSFSFTITVTAPSNVRWTVSTAGWPLNAFAYYDAFNGSFRLSQTSGTGSTNITATINELPMTPYPGWRCVNQSGTAVTQTAGGVFDFFDSSGRHLTFVDYVNAVFTVHWPVSNFTPAQ